MAFESYLKLRWNCSPYSNATFIFLHQSHLRLHQNCTEIGRRESALINAVDHANEANLYLKEFMLDVIGDLIDFSFYFSFFLGPFFFYRFCYELKLSLLRESLGHKLSPFSEKPRKIGSHSAAFLVRILMVKFLFEFRFRWNWSTFSNESSTIVIKQKMF